MSVLPKNFGVIPKSRVPFSDRLSGLCAMELCSAHGDADRIGEMIERLVSSLAFTIAIASKGNPKRIEEMMQGAEAYLAECATQHAKVGAALNP